MRVTRFCVAFTFVFSSWPRALVSQAGAPSVHDLAAKYELARVNGSALPATFTDAKGRVWTLTDGRVELFSNGSWTLKLNGRKPQATKGSGLAMDFGNVALRDDNTITLTSSIYGTHPVTIASGVLDTEYDVDGDKTAERLTFAKPGASLPAAVAVASSAVAPSAVAPSAVAPPVVAPSAIAPSAAAPSAVAPFALDGLYRLQLVNGKTLPPGAGRHWTSGGTLRISSEGIWQLTLHTRSDIALEGRTGGDRGYVVRTGNDLTFVSNEFGDSHAVTSGKGTITIDYYFFGDRLPDRYVWVKEGVADDPAKSATAPRTQSAPIPARWLAVSAGAFHACGLASDGKAYCWGLRARPIGSAGGDAPSPVPGGLTFASLSVGNATACSRDRQDESCATSNGYHACALTSAGDTYCWGSNQLGQLGDGGTSDSPAPVKVTGGIAFASISAGDAFTCGVSKTHVLYCWGRNGDGELGIGSVDGAPHPTPQQIAGEVRAVSASADYACALGDDGTPFCWGNGSNNRMGSSQAVGYGPNPRPVGVETDQKFTTMSAGRSHVCAVTSTGAVYCWGNNSYSESGPGNTRLPSHLPTNVAFASVVAATAYQTCALTASGAAYCWGNNNKDQLGSANAADVCGLEQWTCSSLPVSVSGVGTRAFASISSGVEFTCGVTTSGELLCWGDNSRGQLGLGDRERRATPAKVGAP